MCVGVCTIALHIVTKQQICIKYHSSTFYTVCLTLPTNFNECYHRRMMFFLINFLLAPTVHVVHTNLSEVM